MKFLSYPDRDMLVIDVANQLLEDLTNVLDREERVSFAVPGGSTPAPIFDLLAGASIDWDRVDILLTDERWVPQTDHRSNAGLVKTRLLTGNAAQGRLVPLYRENMEPEAAVAEIAAQIRHYLPLSIVVLGMGSDMHTASLFPDAPELESALASDAPPVVTLRPPTSGVPRVSLSARALTESDCCHLVIMGDEKRTALERANTLSPSEAPVRAVLDECLVHWAA